MVGAAFAVACRIWDMRMQKGGRTAAGGGLSLGPRCRFTSALEVGLMEAIAVRPTRMLPADDHWVVRNGFRMILAAQSDMEVVGEASNRREAVEMG